MGFEEILINVGDLAKDTITGFEGVIVAKCQYLFGCSRVLIEPCALQENGQPHESCWFDIYRIEIVKEKYFSKNVESAQKNDPGGPQDNPIRFYNMPPK